VLFCEMHGKTILIALSQGEKDIQSWMHCKKVFQHGDTEDTEKKYGGSRRKSSPNPIIFSLRALCVSVVNVFFRKSSHGKQTPSRPRTGNSVSSSVRVSKA